MSARSFFEPAFGASFDRVRVHTDPGSERSAARLDARAFTVGSDIGFARGEYRPESHEGQRLIAHELAHVVQQTGGPEEVRTYGGDENAFEREANAAEETISRGQSPVISAKAPANIPARDPEDHSDESYFDFVQRVRDRAVSRLRGNIVSLNEWRTYINGMEGFQIRAQLLSGGVNEYAARASEFPGWGERFETVVGTRDPGLRAYEEFRLARDAPYEEGVQAVRSRLRSGLLGYETTPSINERMQILAGDRTEASLPPPEYVGPDPRYWRYQTDAIMRWVTTGEGSCQTCHDIKDAGERTAEEYGERMPGATRFPNVDFGPLLLTGAPRPGSLNQRGFSDQDLTAMATFIASMEEGAAPMPAATISPVTTDPSANPAANPFLPDIPIPENIERPIPRTNLCGELPAEGSEARDYLEVASSWGPQSAIAVSLIRRIGAVLAPLGPRGYRILPRQTFDSLWAAGPEEMETVRATILDNLQTRQEKYEELILHIELEMVPYEELCPIVDELLPTTNAMVRDLVKFEIELHRAVEAIIDTLLAIVGAALLLCAFLFPPSIMLSAPMLAAGAGLSLAGIATGARDFRRGSQYELGIGAGVYTRAQEEQAKSLRAFGAFNMVANAIGLLGSLRTISAVSRARGAGVSALADSTPIGVVQGSRVSDLPGGGKMLWHPDFPGEAAFIDADGITLMDAAGNQVAFWPRSTVQTHTSGAGSAGADWFSMQGTVAAPDSPAGLLTAGSQSSTALVPFRGSTLAERSTSVFGSQPPALLAPEFGGGLSFGASGLPILQRRLLASNFFRSRTGLVGEEFLERLPGETDDVFRERVMDAIDERFDDALYNQYRSQIDAGFLSPKEDWIGFVFQRKGEVTRFDAESRRIVFALDMSLNKFTVAEEVQHALDYTLGARSPREMMNRGIQALAERRGLSFLQVKNNLSDADADWINLWWHRRVFTRLIRNIHAENYGLGYLKPRINEVHQLYEEIGGRLTLDEILAGQWEDIY